jgi:hypothetical protein
MDSIEIKNFKIEGKMSEEMEAQLKQRFPKADVLSAEKRDAQRAKQEAERAARKAKLAPFSQNTLSGWIASRSTEPDMMECGNTRSSMMMLAI